MISSIIQSLLIADDDMDDVVLLLSAINACNTDIGVTHVTDGAELMAFLESETKPELLLLDINMPKVNGIDCLKRIKANASCKDIPVIMYSTTSNLKTIDECYQHGATRYVIKPFKYEEILAFMKIIFAVDWKNAKMVSKDQFVLATTEL